MKIQRKKSQVLLVGGALAMLLLNGCAASRENTLLASARENFTKVQADPGVNKYAPLELQEAKLALDKAENNSRAGADMAEVDHLAYLAKQKALLSAEVAAMKIADQKVEEAGSERNRVLLGARTREAEQAQKVAELAAQEATAQRLSAEEAQKQAQLSSAAAEKARQDTAAAEARAVSLELQIVSLNAVQTERGLVLTLGDLFFDNGKSDLKNGAYPIIEKLVAFLQEYPSRTVEIEGFTDSVGSEEYNLGLSLHRAEAVRNALRVRNIAGERILSNGYGETFPVATNDTAEGRQLNRRVEIVISDEQGVIAQRVR